MRAGVRGGGVGETHQAGLANEIALERGKGWLLGEIGTALEVIRLAAHALPIHRDTGETVGRGRHFQDGYTIGRVCAGNPLGPVTPAISRDAYRG